MPRIRREQKADSGRDIIAVLVYEEHAGAFYKIKKMKVILVRVLFYAPPRGKGSELSP